MTEGGVEDIAITSYSSSIFNIFDIILLFLYLFRQFCKPQRVVSSDSSVLESCLLLGNGDYLLSYWSVGDITCL